MHGFIDRHDAGRQLAAQLRQYAGSGNVVVVALPNGGVPVGREVARALRAPLEVLVDQVGRPSPNVRDRIVIVVDDGLTTESTMLEAVDALKRLGPRRVIAAAPVGSADVCCILRAVADDCICVLTHFPMHGVGEWYADFSQPPGEEVFEFAGASSIPDGSSASAGATRIVESRAK